RLSLSRRHLVYLRASRGGRSRSRHRRRARASDGKRPRRRHDHQPGDPPGTDRRRDDHGPGARRHGRAGDGRRPGDKQQSRRLQAAFHQKHPGAENRAGEIRRRRRTARFQADRRVRQQRPAGGDCQRHRRRRRRAALRAAGEGGKRNRLIHRLDGSLLFCHCCCWVLLVIGAPWSLHAHGKKPATLPELAAYTGADREQILTAGARAEGKVVWYTSLAGNSYRELAQGFEKKYPGIKVEVYRAASNELMARIGAEAQARQYRVDTIETTLPLLKSLREDGLLAVYTSPHLAQYPARAKVKADNGLYYWGVNRESFIGVGFNPNLVPPSAVPKN